MEYTFAKLYKGKKGWYVYYRFKNPVTGVMDQFKERSGLNKKGITKIEKEEIAFGLIANRNKKLKAGYSPFSEVNYDKENFYWWFERYIESANVENKSEYFVNAMQAVLNKMKMHSPTLLVKNFDEDFIVGLRGYMKKKGNSINTIADNMMRIGFVAKKIVKDGTLLYHKNPMLDVKIKKTKTIKRRINIEDVNRLYGCGNLTTDMYVFSFYGAGIRFGDLCRIENEWIKTRLSYSMHKTKANMSFKLHPIAEAIFKKHASKEKYLFNTGIDPLNESKSIKYLNGEFNKKLKKACKELELPELTFHTARHSFANHAKRNTNNKQTIQELLAHGDSKTTDTYLSSFNEEEIDESMAGIFKLNK